MAAPDLKIQLANSSLAGAGSFALTRSLVRAVGLGVPRPPCLSPAVLTPCISAIPSACLAVVPPPCSHRTWAWGCLSCFWHSCGFNIGHSLCCDLEITSLEGSKPVGFKDSSQRARKCSRRGFVLQTSCSRKVLDAWTSPKGCKAAKPPAGETNGRRKLWKAHSTACRSTWKSRVLLQEHGGDTEASRMRSWQRAAPSRAPRLHQPLPPGLLPQRRGKPWHDQGPLQLCNVPSVTWAQDAAPAPGHQCLRERDWGARPPRSTRPVMALAERRWHSPELSRRLECVTSISRV